MAFPSQIANPPTKVELTFSKGEESIVPSGNSEHIMSKWIHPSWLQQFPDRLPKAALQKRLILCWAPHLHLNGELLRILGQPSTAQLLFPEIFHLTPMTYNNRTMSHYPVIITVTFTGNEGSFPTRTWSKIPSSRWELLSEHEDPSHWQALPEDTKCQRIWTKHPFICRVKEAQISKWHTIQ